MTVKENVVATTRDWLSVGDGMEITSYYPAVVLESEHLEVSEPDRASNLPAVERARMNRARPGIHTVPERL
jgi:hypothetical protein